MMSQGDAVKNFILIANDYFLDTGKICPAIDIARDRLTRKLWPLYKRTNNRNIFKNGDRLIIYIAGKSHSKQSFIATALVKNLTTNNNARMNDLPDYDLAAVSFLNLESIQIFEPISIFKKIDKLSFIPINRKKWGTALMGGSRSISDNDYFEILSEKMEAIYGK